MFLSKVSRLLVKLGEEMNNDFRNGENMKKQSQSFGKPWFARELQDIEGFADENNIIDIAGNVFVDSEPEVLPPEVDLLDMSTVDVILISNCFFMFALPYITEHTNFSGTIYATEPTLQMG
ncbi:integrator complex subunit 9, partial [Paramuricea clavata]